MRGPVISDFDPVFLAIPEGYLNSRSIESPLKLPPNLAHCRAMQAPNQAQFEFWNGDMAQRWLSVEAAHYRAFKPVSDALLAAADIGPDDTILDVGCGTGDTTLRAAAMTSGMVLGLDISDVMLERARKSAAGVNNVAFQSGDAQTHAFEPRTFDRLVSRFGMMFFDDLVAAFRNLQGAMTPNGSMTFICWGDPDSNPWFGLPRKVAADRLGAPPPQDPNAPGPFGFADGQRVVGLMQAAGLKDPVVEVVDIGLTAGDTPKDVLEGAAVGPIASLMREKNGGPDDLAAILEAYAIALADYQTDEGIVIPARLNLFRANA